MSIIDTTGLVKRMEETGLQLIDARSPEAYNGWRHEGAPRGGHIPGARSLPQKWSAYMDWIEIVRAKGIDPELPVCVYHDAPEAAHEVAALFARTKHREVYVYEDFLAKWVSSAKLPLERLKRYRHLVGANWLKALLDTGNAPEYDNDRYVLCHAHYQNRSAYDQGHIPGAVQVDTNTLESPETWNRRSPEALNETLSRLGITSETTVILYGRFAFPNNDDSFPGSAAGHLGAIRSALIMMYAGVRDVRILNGGLQSWSDAGFEVTSEETLPSRVPAFNANIPVNPHLFVDTPEAKEILAAPDKNLVSVRSWPEFIGEVSGYNYIAKKGRIPGAVFGNCGSDAYHMENYRNLDHTTREYGEIAAFLSEAGISSKNKNAFYCGTGWRGAEAWLNTWLMGWPDVAVYDGGWFEWSNDPQNPFDTGVPNSDARVVRGGFPHATK